MSLKKMMYIFILCISLFDQASCARCFLGGALATAGIVYGAHLYRTPPSFIEPVEKNMHIITLSPVGKGPYKTVTRMRTLVNTMRAGKDIPLESIIRIHKKDGSGFLYGAVQPGIAVPGFPEHVCIYTNGNRLSSSTLTGAGAISVYGRIKSSLIPVVPCIAFDHPDDNYRYFDFGRTAELALVFQQVKERCPQAQITLMGECGGGLRTLKYVAANPDEAVRNLVIFSPMPGLDALAQGIYDAFVKRARAHYLISAALVKKILLYLFPSYSAAHDNLLAVAHKISGKKIFIAYHRRDIIIPNSYMQQLVVELARNNEVYFLVVDGQELIPHDSIEKFHHSIQLAVQAFYKRCNLPHDEVLAAQGVPFLAQAACWAQNPEQGFAHPVMS